MLIFNMNPEDTETWLNFSFTWNLENPLLEIIDSRLDMQKELTNTGVRSLA